MWNKDANSIQYGYIKCGTKMQILFSMAILNVERKYECFPKLQQE